MKRLATGLLVAMVLLFVAASLLRTEYPALGIVEAFAEAAMIGALADWFAVTALFKHPLGLPIPHTAIVPNRKNEIGRALARFIRDHFLTRETVAGRLARANLVARAGGWLANERNARLLSRDASLALDWVMRAVDSDDLRHSIRTGIRGALEHVPVNLVLATLIDVALRGDHGQRLIDQLVKLGRDQLDTSKFDIRLRIRAQSPWWMPKFVDEKIYDQLVGEFERILTELSQNPAHPARAQLNEQLRSLRTSLEHDEELIRKGQSLWDDLVDHADVQRYLSDVWARIRDDLQTSLTTPGSALRLGIEREIQAIGGRIVEDEAVAARLDGRLEELLIYVVETYRDAVSAVISETIEQWDPAATAQRIELHIGRDLQFIRINGTLVGGLVGVLIYLVWGAVV